MTVPIGTTSLIILGTFVAPYEVGVCPAWATDKTVRAVNKLATQFTVDFAVPPSALTSLDWGVLDSG